MTFATHVVWHDVECGRYDADLALWRALAAATGGPVLDIGAGTGRVALDLARAGHAVTALDREPALLDALSERATAAGLRVPTVFADAMSLSLDTRFALIVVPMQTIQLLPARYEFLARARRHLRPDGLLAVAIAAALEDFGEDDGELPPPDVGAVGGWRFASQPIAVRALPAATRIVRVRRSFAPDGRVTEEQDTIELAHLTVETLEAEGVLAGFTAEPSLLIPPTTEHVGSKVVLLRA